MAVAAGGAAWGQAGGRAGRARIGVAGSLVLRRMDRRGHKRGTGAPLRRGLPLAHLDARSRRYPRLSIMLSFLETRRVGRSKSKLGSKLGYGHGKRVPKPVDVHVGARLRVRRTLLGMNQTTVGEAIGLTFQQVQKYENGTNRISASRLFDLSRVLDVPIQYFFDDMPTAVAASSPAQGGCRAKMMPSYEPDPMAKRETLELLRAY